jgi:hypothetical protein
MQKYLPDVEYFIGKHVPNQSGNYIIVEHRGSGMNAHVFRAHSDELRHDIAVKIVPRQNLKPNWQQEFQKANILRSQVVVKFFSVNEWKNAEHIIDCVVLLSDYIHGKNLREHIQMKKDDISINFIMDLLKGMFDLFHEMSERGFQHGDLHSGNILVEDQSTSLIGPEYAFRVTDFGVTSATEHGNVKNDFENLSFILKDLLENVDYQSAEPLEKHSFNILNDHFLAKHLMETDTTRDPYARRPRKLFDRLKEIDSEFDKIQTDKAVKKINDPFEYLSCEQIGDSHSLLKSLYSILKQGII